MSLVRHRPVIAMADRVMEELRLSDLTPQEAMAVVEMLLWTLMKNALDGISAVAGDQGEQLQREGKLMCTRVLMRLTTQIAAWPAEATQRH